MKKILLSTILLISSVSANAVNWQAVDSKVPDIDVYVDMDSIHRKNYSEYCYAIRYQASGQSEKIAYIKANSQNNTLGIIHQNDYDAEKYRPNAFFDNPHVFMKPVKRNSFLDFTNDYVATLVPTNAIADNNAYYNGKLQDTVYVGDYSPNSEVPVSNIRSVKAQQAMPANELETFLYNTCEQLKANWKTPILGYTARTTVVATIGRDGSLLNYKILDSNGNDVNDRSIVAALEKTVPYPQVKTENVYNNTPLEFQFIFVNDIFKKTVTY